jgi:hypothetical protein
MAPLSDLQRSVFGRYLAAHQRAATISLNPLWLALVIAGDRPAAMITPHPKAFPYRNQSLEQCFHSFLDLFDLQSQAIPQSDQWCLTPTAARFEILPTQWDPSTAEYHLRLGLFLGYPPAAIVSRLCLSEPRPHPRSLVAQGHFEASELAYTLFLPYVYITPDVDKGYAYEIAAGKAYRQRITAIAEQWQLPVLDALADAIHHEYTTQWTSQ